jgi:hypothetical protein
MPHRYYTLRNLIVLSDLQPPRKPLVVEVRRVRHLKGDLLIIERCPFCDQRHVHGAADKPDCGDHGHRQPHCRDLA